MSNAGRLPPKQSDLDYMSFEPESSQALKQLPLGKSLPLRSMEANKKHMHSVVNLNLASSCLLADGRQQVRRTRSFSTPSSNDHLLAFSSSKLPSQLNLTSIPASPDSSERDNIPPAPKSAHPATYRGYTYPVTGVVNMEGARVVARDDRIGPASRNSSGSTNRRFRRWNDPLSDSDDDL